MAPRWSLLPPDISVTMLLRQQLPFPADSNPVEGVLFTEDVARQLAATWQSSVRQDVEKAWCLMGRRAGDRVVVTGLRRPQVAGADHRRVDFFTLPCLAPGFVGTLHTHPSGNCGLSEVDLSNFRLNRMARVEVVLCGPRRIAWVDRQPEAATRVTAVRWAAPADRGMLGD